MASGVTLNTHPEQPGVSLSHPVGSEVSTDSSGPGGLPFPGRCNHNSQENPRYQPRLCLQQGVLGDARGIIFSLSLSLSSPPLLQHRFFFMISLICFDWKPQSRRWLHLARSHEVLPAHRSQADSEQSAAETPGAPGRAGTGHRVTQTASAVASRLRRAAPPRGSERRHGQGEPPARERKRGHSFLSEPG